ncbi:MAG: hypothetical protein ACE14T_01675 [Syntrophales bacterium]
MIEDDIFYRKDIFLEHVINKLGNTPIDFCEKIDSIYREENGDKKWRAAGVLLPLSFKPQSGAGGKKEFFLHLIKRSREVTQAGDLSCPGGMLNTHLDQLLRPLIAYGLLPVLKGDALRYARNRGEDSFRNITLFLANALRESWEEVGINPFHVRFLGALPCRNLVLFTRTIFPLVGFVKEWHIRPNWEVEKIVAIPVRSFFDKGNYALYSVEVADSLSNRVETTSYFQCFVHREENGDEEILWGATFYIVESFLKIAFGFDMPAPSPERILKKTLHPVYLTGNRNKRR